MRKTKKRATLEGAVTGLFPAGEGRAVTDEGAFFRVAGALPGDRVVLRPINKRRGDLVKVLTRSPDRVQPPCAHAEACGGCPLMGLSPVAQAREKQGWISRVLGGQVPVDWASTEHSVGYRTRARLHFSRGQFGYRRRRSARVFPVPTCAVLAAPLEVVRSTLASLAESLEGEGEVRLELGPAGVVVSLASKAAQPQAAYAWLSDAIERGELAGAALRVGGASSAALLGDTGVSDGDYAGNDVLGEVGGFGQANREMNNRLIAEVEGAVGESGGATLELFAGRGNLTRALLACTPLTLVESEPRATEALRANLKRWGKHAKVITGDAAEVPKGPFQTIVLDPPRIGAGPSIGGILRAKPQRVIYVSCNPQTLGQDVGRLVEGGMTVERALGFDMFPHTAHVESMVVLTA